jgi:hypothetical protein
VVVWKPRPTSCPDKTRWFGTSMWQIRSGGRGHIPIPSKAVNPTQTTIHLYTKCLQLGDTILPRWVDHISCVFFVRPCGKEENGSAGTCHTFSTNSMMRAWPETLSQHWTRWAATWDFHHPSVFFIEQNSGFGVPCGVLEIPDLHGKWQYHRTVSGGFSI